MAESEEALKSLLMKVKEESGKVGLNLNIQKTKIMASGPITSWQIGGETEETVSNFILGGSKITADGDCSHEIKRRLLLGRKVITNLDSILKRRDITLPTKVRLVSSGQSLSRVRLFATPWIAACQVSLSITISRSLHRLTSIESVMPSSHLILYHPLLLLPPIPSSITVFSNESTLHMRWSTGVSALASFLPKKSRGWSPSEWTGWISLQSKGLSRVFSNTTVQKHQFFGAQLSSQSNSHIHTWPLEKPYPWLDRPLLAK